MPVKLIEIQRAVVVGRGQAEAVVDQALLARMVARVHRAHLRQRDVRFIDEQQKILGEVIQQRAGLAAGRAARHDARIILDALAHADLAEHLDVVARALLDALRLKQLSVFLKITDAVLHFRLDLPQRALHFLARHDVVRGRVDRDVL